MTKKKVKNDTSLDTLFKPMFNLVRGVLDDVILEQAGALFFKVFYEVVTCAQACRDKKEKINFQPLNKIIDGLSSQNRSRVIKSLNLFFQLSNLVEDQYRVDVNRCRALDHDDQRQDTLKQLVTYAKKKRLSLPQLLELFLDIELCLVWTAHPTDTTRMSRISTIQAIIKLLNSFSFQTHTDFQLKKMKRTLNRYITLLWQTDEIRHERIRVLDEVRRNLSYVEKSLFPLVPRFLEDLRLTIADAYGVTLSKVKLPVFLTFNLWPGGDRDGNPFVTASVTQQSLYLQRRMVLCQYLQGVQNLVQELSISTEQISISKALERSITKDQRQLSNGANETDPLNHSEPYVQKCEFMSLKLENTLNQLAQFSEQCGVGLRQRVRGYVFMDDFLSELKLIQESLIQNKGESITFGLLQVLIDQVCMFEQLFLDIRFHASVHRRVLEECFTLLEFDVSTDMLFSSVLVKELTQTRLLGVDSFIDQLSDEAKDLFETLRVIKNPEKMMSRQLVRSYIISMTATTEDILTALFLLKEEGLIRVSQGKVSRADVDIVPLFETKKALSDSVTIMKTLFSDPFYQSYLKKRQNVQEIMLGYSDSNKDIGAMASQFTLVDVQNQLIELAKHYHIQIRFFHGRGGTISRGGGPMNRALQALPVGAVSSLKITEQGEMVPINYTNPGIAYRHLEQIVHAVVMRTIQDDHVSTIPFHQKPATTAIVQDMARMSQNTYETLVKKTRGFYDFFHQVTPIDLIEYTLIGSRPSKRSKKEMMDVDITNQYRAIPWVFSWMQSRLLLPGFYGVGTALQGMEKQHGIELFRGWYEKWPFFQSFIQNLQMVLLKADMAISEQYLQLHSSPEEARYFFDQIKDEHECTTQCVLQITQQGVLMEKAPKIRGRILRRNPCVDPFNLIQIQLLTLWRKRRRLSEEKIQHYQQELLETVNGITAGIRNFG